MAFMNRKIYLIKKDFQMRFILRFVTTATVWAAATVVLFVVLAEKRLEDIRYSTHIAVRTTSDVLLPSAVTAQLVTLLIFGAILAYSIHSLWERLTIPLLSIKKDIMGIAIGNLVSPVTVGQEEFHDLAGDLDRMRIELRAKVVRMKNRHAAVSAAAADLQKSILKGNPSAVHASLLRESLSGMKEEIDGFKYG